MTFDFDRLVLAPDDIDLARSPDPSTVIAIDHMPSLEPSPELTRPIEYKMYPRDVVFATGIATREDWFVLPTARPSRLPHHAYSKGRPCARLTAAAHSRAAASALRADVATSLNDRKRTRRL